MVMFSWWVTRKRGQCHCHSDVPMSMVVWPSLVVEFLPVSLPPPPGVKKVLVIQWQGHRPWSWHPQALCLPLWPLPIVVATIAENEEKLRVPVSSQRFDLSLEHKKRHTDRKSPQRKSTWRAFYTPLNASQDRLERSSLHLAQALTWTNSNSVVEGQRRVTQ